MSSNDAPLYSARDVASSRYQVRCVASSVSTPSSRARASSVSELVADAVSRGEQPALGQQAALLGEQQEDHPHHHGDCGLVDLVPVGGQRVRLALVAGLDGGLGHRLHQQLDRAPDLRAQRLGDLLGGRDRLPEQLGQQVLGLAADQAGQAQQLDERVAGGGILDPRLGVEDPGGDHGLRSRADDRPPAPIGDHADRDSRGAQQLFHPVDRACRPAVGRRVAQRVDRIDDQDQRPGRVPARQCTGRGDGDRIVR